MRWRRKKHAKELKSDLHKISADWVSYPSISSDVVTKVWASSKIFSLYFQFQNHGVMHYWVGTDIILSFFLIFGALSFSRDYIFSLHVVGGLDFSQYLSFFIFFGWWCELLSSESSFFGWWCELLCGESSFPPRPLVVTPVDLVTAPQWHLDLQRF